MALIDLTYLKKFKPISENIDSLERLIPFIDEAERVDLRPFLGDALHYDMMANLTAQKYKDLLDGVVYTYCGNPIRFDGLKPFIAYMGYARFIVKQQMNVTSFGVVHKKNEFSEPVPQKIVSEDQANARQVAAVYQTAAVQFLNEKHSVYPLWNCSTKPRKASVIISSVSKID